MSRLVQVGQRHARVEKLERGVKPVFELELEDHQSIIGVYHSWEADYRTRKTVDHHAIFWVASDLGGAA